MSVIAVIAQIDLNQAIVKSIAESNNNSVSKAQSAIINTSSILLPVILIISATFILLIGPWLGVKIMHSDTVLNATILIVSWIAVTAEQCFMTEIFRGFYDIKRAVLLGSVITHLISLTGLLT